MSKSRHDSHKKQKNSPKSFHFKLIDWLFIIFGVITSFITLFSDLNHSLVYIIASIFALNCGVFEIILSINGRRSNYIFAVLNAIACIVIAFMDQFYGNMIINIYYIPLSIVGFYLWGKHSDKNRNVIAHKLTLKQTSILIIASTISSIGLGLALILFDGHSVFLDSISTVLIVIASVLMVLRYRENWIVWIIADTLLLILFISTNNPAVIIMRLFNLLSSIYGYINWRKLLKKSISRHHSKCTN